MSACSFANDDRFVTFWYTDSAFRPKLNSKVCVGHAPNKSLDGNALVEFNNCAAGSKSHQQWTLSRYSGRRLSEEDRSRLEECTDEPFGWYDTFGKHATHIYNMHICVDLTKLITIFAVSVGRVQLWMVCRR